MSEDFLREQLIALLPVGRDHATSAKQLASELGTTPRRIGQLVAEIIEVDGYCVGSLCGEDHGYFLIADAADLEAGAAHIVHRAVRSFDRVRALRRNWAAMDRGQTALFDEFNRAVG